MKKILILIMVIFLATGCTPEKKVDETKTYIKEVRKLSRSIVTFGKEINKILKDESEEEQAVKTEEEIIKLQKEIKEFERIEPPKSLRHVHRQIVNKNYVLYDTLDITLNSIRAGKKVNEVTQDLLIKVKQSKVVDSIHSLLKKEGE